MLTRSKIGLSLIAGLLVSAGSLIAQDSGALIDLLTRKGIINDQEAEELRAELIKDFASSTSAGKLSLGSHLTEFKLSGDVRIRHQEQTQSTQFKGYQADEQRRERFRFRLNGDFLMQKGWGAGFALETGQASDSGNQSYTGGADDYGIFLARAYVSYRPNNNTFVVLGKQKNPLYTTDLNWDSDINPQGFSETYRLDFAGKNNLEFRALQSIMVDRNESDATTTNPDDRRDAWLFAQQAVYTQYFGRDSIGNQINNFILAGGFSLYNQQANLTGLTNEQPFNGTSSYLKLGTLAGEVNLMNIVGSGTALKVYFDSSYNFDAEKRVRDAYGFKTTDTNGNTILAANAGEDALAWLIGVGYSFGTGKNQGDYSAKLDFRRVGLGAVDPNTTDSDFALGFLNQQGFKLATSYNVTDFASVGLNYFYTWDIRKTLSSGLAARDHTQVLQADLVVKF